MAILETVLPILGASVAKYLLTKWLGDSLTSKVAEGGVDLAKDEISRILGQPVNKNVDHLAQEIVERIYQQLDRPFQDLESNERQSALFEAALTLDHAQLTSRLLVEFKLNSGRLARHLGTTRPDAQRDLSNHARVFYRDLLNEVSRQLIDTAAKLDGFEREFAKQMLNNDAILVEAVAKLIALPDQAAADFETKYLEAINFRFNKLELFGVQQVDTLIRRQHLMRAYTALQIELPVESDSDQGKRFTFSALPNLATPDSESIESIKRERRLFPAEEGLALSHRLVLTGDAGSGKTTFLRWIAVQTASHTFTDELASWSEKIPFFISLRECSKKRESFPLPEQFAAYSTPTISGQMPPGWVHHQLEIGRAIVLIDGVDELPRVQRAELLGCLEDLVKTYPLARYIISSRPTALKESEWPAWQEWMQSEKFVNAYLQPMTSEQVDTFISHWFTALEESTDDPDLRLELNKQPGALQRLLKQRPPLRKLAVNPLLCAMVCALFHERGHTLPKERLNLYEECIEMLLTRRDEGRRIESVHDYPEPTFAQWLVFASSLAYWMMRNGYSEINQKEADEHFTRHLPAMALPNVTGEQVRRFLVERASLLREPVMGHIDFTHRTFQEYLAAHAILDNGDLGYLLKHATDDQWRETLITATGLARPKERKYMLEGLLTQGNKSNKKDAKLFYLLATACLETCVELDPALRQRILDKASSILPPQDEDEVKLIASAGDPVVSLLAERLNYKDEQAARCVDALALIGTPGAMSEIATYSHRCQVEDSVSVSQFNQVRNDNQRIAAALGSAWSSFDCIEYAKKVLGQTDILVLNELNSTDGFEYLKHLKILFINSGSITDLEPLADLVKLRLLRLNNIPVNDLSALTSLGQLENLDFSNTQVSNLSPLAGLNRLITLWIDHTPVSDLSTLSNLKHLQTLWLGNSHVSDLSPLANFTHLHFLFLDNTLVSDLSPLANLANLFFINLSNTQISDLSPLSGLVQLQMLYFSDTRISDLSPLANLANLNYLHLSNNQISDLSPLAGLVQLQRLNFSNTQVSDISSLAGLVQLQSLNFSNTPVSSISSLASLAQLEDLNLSNTQVSDLSPLSYLSHLKKLTIKNINPIDLSVLNNLTEKGLQIEK